MLLPSAAVLALTFPLPASGAGGPATAEGPGTTAIPAGFAAPGSPAWTPDAEWLGGPVPALAGLAAGGWDWRDPFGSAPLVWPGLAEAAPPAAWADTLHLRVGGLGAAHGFGAPLARREAGVSRPTARRARAVFTVLNGSAAVDRTGLLLARGDERSWFRGGSHGARRGALGSMGQSGEHLWFASGGLVRGDHETWGRYTQSGFGNQQELGGLREGGRAESGAGGWTVARGTRRLSAWFERAHDGRDSRGNGVAFAESRRDASEDALALEAADSLGWGRLIARARFARARVVRVTPEAAEVREAWSARSGWTSLSLERPLAGGRLTASLGGGRHDAAERREERWQLAPSAEWSRFGNDWRTRLFADRTVTPVWSDLAPGVPAFTQDAWLAGAEAAVGSRPGAWAEGRLVAGRVAQRATLVRYPIRDVALRLGWQRDEGRAPLALAMVAGGLPWAHGALDASAFAQVRPEERSQPRVDPGYGGVAGAEGAFRAFAGDLAVRLRVQAALVGTREVEYSAYDGVEPRTLPAYTTLSAALQATLGDATLGLRMTNLEDRRQPQVWIDPLTGAPALGVGRQLTFEIVWPLFD